VTVVAPSGTADVVILEELVPEVKVIEGSFNAEAPTSFLTWIRLALNLALLVPHSDVVVSTHTPTTGVGFLASRLLRRGRLVWLYQDYLEMFESRPFEAWLLKHALYWHDMALVVSDYSRRELRSFYTGKEIVVVGEGISQREYFKPVENLDNLYRAVKEILFLGDMRPRKGLFDFLAASSLLYKELENIRLRIVSKDDLVVDTEVPFDFVYRPSRKELARLYATCDLFVSASWWESFGLPPLEAMACGAPVVMTDSRGVQEYAIAGYNCLLSPPRDPEALAVNMERVLTDVSLSRHLSNNGPITAACFTWDEAVDRFEAALIRLGSK
jgi:glycosyltransferase involved in cell wall biosynthesis